DILGLVALERVATRVRGTALLPWLAALALGGVVLLLIAGTVAMAGIALFLVGLGSVGWYPIAQAAAYGTHPGRSGAVRAVIGLAEPVEVVLPAVVGLVAGRFGLVAAIAFLGLAPLGVLLAGPRATRG
ncbi:MAG: hypothetical protein IVW57_11920, partial [Ktedonobacterales bacterium]|nr:hypothetical protein [Ktedonobacterales bacterium]